MLLQGPPCPGPAGSAVVHGALSLYLIIIQRDHQVKNAEINIVWEQQRDTAPLQLPHRLHTAAASLRLISSFCDTELELVSVPGPFIFLI